MAIVKPSKPYTFIDGAGNTAVGAEVNDNFDTLYSKIGEVIDVVNNAAGTKATLDARLDVALNEDGTQKTALTAGGEWINPGFTATYISATQFSVPGDHTDIYLVGRRVKVGLAASTVFSTISASSYGLGVTTVTVGSVLTNPIRSVEHGIVTPDNGSSSLPTDFMTTAATPNKGVQRDTDGKIFANQTYTDRTGQTSWDKAALVSVGIDSNGSAVGFANGVSGAMLVHPPGGGIEARNGDRSALIKIKAAAGAAADDLVTKAQHDLKANTTDVLLLSDSPRGRVSWDGVTFVTILAPPGWTVTRFASGIHRIVHNLGHNNFTPMLTVTAGSGDITIKGYHTDLNTFTVETISAGTSNSASFSFVFFLD